jgi:hypothetical protein
MNKACRAGASRIAPRRSISTPNSVVMRRMFWRSAAAWARPRPSSPPRTRGNDYLGIEVHTPGVGSLLKEIATRELTNLRVIQHDAVEVVRDMIPSGSLAGIHVFFPDPWPKKRQQKRRLIQPEFVALLASRLCAAGYLHCATDWEDYAHQMLAVLACRAAPAATWPPASQPRPPYRPQTKFESARPAPGPRRLGPGFPPRRTTVSVDPRTVILLAGVMGGMMSVVLLFMRRNYPVTIGGLGEWATASALIFLSTLLLGARDVIPDFFSVVAGIPRSACRPGLFHLGSQKVSRPAAYDQANWAR